jgi:hypothetical protein
MSGEDKHFTQEAKFLFMPKILAGNEFSFCNNTETLFPGIKMLLHHYYGTRFWL